jgi:hypothetical protein
MVAVAPLLAIGLVLARNGHGQHVAVQSSTAAATGEHSAGAATASRPSQAAIPEVSRAMVEQKLRGLGVSLTPSAGYETGHVTDAATGADLHVTVYLAASGDLITGIQCIFTANDIKVNAQLVDRARQCVTPVVPVDDQTAVSSWLTANGTGVSVDSSRQYELDGLRVTVGRITTAFSVIITVPASSTG